MLVAIGRKWALTILALALIGASMVILTNLANTNAIELKLDQESYASDGKLINPSTQSLNRSASVLNRMNSIVDIKVDLESGKLNFSIGRKGGDEKVIFNNIDYSQHVPMLHYPKEGRDFDEFDQVNLMLAEYARNGAEYAYQETNSMFGYFKAEPSTLFNHEGEYLMNGSEIIPNAFVRPNRFNVVNNCLFPGLWELSAVDSVGEIYHAWFDMPMDTYVAMIQSANNLAASKDEIQAAVQYKSDVSHVFADLDRLRNLREEYYSGTPKIVVSKKVGSYSTQDSRRKMQNKYFEILRDGEPVEVATFADLRIGDVFNMRKFVSPGIYSAFRKKQAEFDPDWQRVSIHSVVPRTQYKGGKSLSDIKDEHLEISIYGSDEKRRLVAGNIPISLLVSQEDYLIPAFGVGLNPPSELAERRFLRIKEGPLPHFAYQLQKVGSEWHMFNNHEGGYEQIAFRVRERDDKVFLRIYLIAYERIVDLLELEVEIKGELADKLKMASLKYTPPMFRVYEDGNLI